MDNQTKITVVGAGYVGMSIAVLLAQHNNVVILDTDLAKVGLVNSGRSTISDSTIDEFLTSRKLHLRATGDKNEAYKEADFVVVATPTDYEPDCQTLNTASVESVIVDASAMNPRAIIVIKSTVPVGFTEAMKCNLGIENVFFSPEFLREGQALNDHLYPDRIIVGDSSSGARMFAELLVSAADKKNISVMCCGNTEAEAIKLFANTYLALRVSYFNELDTYATAEGLNAKNIIEGVCSDKRIGNGYNNPSFGYGGYCLPKDTKQLLSTYKNIPQNIIDAVVESNSTRKKFVANEVIKMGPKSVGIFRLVMKEGSSNFRESSIKDVLLHIREKDIEVIIFEPLISADTFLGCRIENDLNKFKKKSEIILANRNETSLSDVRQKVYTRDIYGVD